ncbi:MAG: ankyrin repeat domain-containing protein [Oligoflexia bacterium]|nr:ankyrin repeat domain-containing protein [Oligoflexia bacterium]
MFFSIFSKAKLEFFLLLMFMHFNVSIAVFASDYSEVEKNPLVKEILLNKVDEKGNTALHIAILKGDFDLASYLLKQKTNMIEKVNSDGKSPIQLAIYNSPPNINIIKELIKSKANIKNISLLDLYKNGKSAIIKELLSSDQVDVYKNETNDVYNDEKNLFFAVTNAADIDMLSSFIEHNVDLNKFINRNETALTYSIKFADPHLIARPEFDKSGEEKRQKHEKFAEKLIDAKADIEIKNILGNAPLYQATLNNNPTLVKKLLVAGADLEAIGQFDSTAWELAQKFRYNYTQPQLYKILKDATLAKQKKVQDDGSKHHEKCQGRYEEAKIPKPTVTKVPTTPAEDIYIGNDKITGKDLEIIGVTDKNDLYMKIFGSTKESEFKKEKLTKWWREHMKSSHPDKNDGNSSSSEITKVVLAIKEALIKKYFTAK